jgi:tetratricopeptide (TPR) repeat protein
LARARRRVAQGDTFAAIHDYTESIRIDPGLGVAYLELARLRSALGDQREVEWLLSRATAISDVRAEALSRRAEFYAGVNKRDLALLDLRAAVEAAPTSDRLRALADFFVQQKAWVAALAIWRRIETSLGPAEPDARVEAGEMIAALAALAAEADGVQHDMPERSWVRRSLRRHATPLRRTR